MATDGESITLAEYSRYEREYWRIVAESKGTRIRLDALVKFNKSMNFTSSYYITLLAHDPAATPLALQKTFPVRVDEFFFGSLDLTVSIARPKRDQNEAATKEPFIPHFHGGAVADGVFKGPLPDWPSDDALNDIKRFYVVKESEWQATDWISLYLELLVCSSDREIADTVPSVISHLQIVEAAMETTE